MKRRDSHRAPLAGVGRRGPGRGGTIDRAPSSTRQLRHHDNAEIDGDKISINAPTFGHPDRLARDPGHRGAQNQVVGRIADPGRLRAAAGSASVLPATPRSSSTTVSRARPSPRARSSRSPTTTRRSSSPPGRRDRDRRVLPVSRSTSRSTPIRTRNITGTVSEIQGGAAGVFSLFPQANTSGNFQKVTRSSRSRSRSRTRERGAGARHERLRQDPQELTGTGGPGVPAPRRLVCADSANSTRRRHRPMGRRAVPLRVDRPDPSRGVAATWS